jgi:hypothetical protein
METTLEKVQTPSFVVLVIFEVPLITCDISQGLACVPQTSNPLFPMRPFQSRGTKLPVFV